MEKIIDMQSIFKVYSNGVVANKSVNFSVNRGEIHALLGENGAGKSTLMKVLLGEEKQQEGKIFISNEEVHFQSSKDAIDKGLGMVYQHFKLIPSFTIAENIILGNEIVKYKYFIDKRKVKKEIGELVERYGFDLNLESKVRDVKVVTKQKIEILKVLYKGSQIIILDEPTAILTPQETKELFKQLIKLKNEGYTIIFITHKLNEVKEICDRLSIMTDGKSMGTYDVKDLSIKEISTLMIGRDILEKYDRNKVKLEKKLLEVKNVSVVDETGKKVVNNASFKLYSKEILGVVGVDGNGQSPLIRSITGLSKIKEGSVFIEDTELTNKNVKFIRDKKISHIPEDRMTTGISKDSTIEENLVSNLIDKKEYKGKFFIKNQNIEKKANEIIMKYEIKCKNSKQQIKSLSGGNIQKVVVARELMNNPKVIVANHPTRGIDVGAAEFIKKELIKHKDNGAGVLFVTADLVEALQICDRIIVMYEGEITGNFINDETLTDIKLGEYMLGIKNDMGGIND